MKSFVLLILLSGSVAAYQDATPTMAQTKAWLERDGARLMHSSSTTGSARTVSQLSTTDVTDVALTDCRLTWTARSTTSTRALGVPPRDSTSVTHFTVPLADLDTGGISAKTVSLHPDEVLFSVSMHTRTDRGKAVVYNRNESGDKTDSGASIYVWSLEDGTRIANAIRTAAQLCGAPSSPL